MKILFTKTQRRFSRLIMGVTGEPCSHVVLDFGWFVVHSDLLGVHISYGPLFRKKHDIVYQLERSTNLQLQDAGRLSMLLDKHEFSLYDFGGLLFLGLALIARKYLKLPLPKSNLWQSTGMFLCTEWVSDFVDDKEDSMITPFGLYERLKLTGNWKDYVNDTQGRPGESDR